MNAFSPSRTLPNFGEGVEIAPNVTLLSKFERENTPPLRLSNFPMAKSGVSACEVPENMYGSESKHNCFDVGFRTRSVFDFDSADRANDECR